MHGKVAKLEGFGSLHNLAVRTPCFANDVALKMKLKNCSHRASVAASALTLAMTVGMGLEAIFERQHQRHSV